MKQVWLGHLANLAHKDLKAPVESLANQVNKDNVEKLDLEVNQDQTDHLERAGKPDLQANRDNQVSRVHVESAVKLDQLAHLDSGENKDLVVNLEEMDQLDHQAHVVIPEALVLMDNLANQVGLFVLHTFSNCLLIVSPLKM